MTTASDRRRQKNWRTKKVNEGLCVGCFKRERRSGRATCVKCLKRALAYQKGHRSRAIELIARHRRQMKCMIDLTSDATAFGVELIKIPCGGPLEIDHINGKEVGGTRERGAVFYRRVAQGERTPEDLRLLCRIHNMLYRRSDEKGWAREGRRGNVGLVYFNGIPTALENERQ